MVGASQSKLHVSLSCKGTWGCDSNSYDLIVMSPMLYEVDVVAYIAITNNRCYLLVLCQIFDNYIVIHKYKNNLLFLYLW